MVARKGFTITKTGDVLIVGKQKKPKSGWCERCCQMVSGVHTCHDFVDGLIEDYNLWLPLMQRNSLKFIIKSIASRKRRYTDFIGGEDE